MGTICWEVRGKAGKEDRAGELWGLESSENIGLSLSKVLHMGVTRLDLHLRKITPNQQRERKE